MSSAPSGGLVPGFLSISFHASVAESLIEPLKRPITVTVFGLEGTTVLSVVVVGGVKGTFPGVNRTGVEPFVLPSVSAYAVLMILSPSTTLVDVPLTVSLTFTVKVN